MTIVGTRPEIIKKLIGSNCHKIAINSGNHDI